jgi:hypothetical protein
VKLDFVSLFMSFDYSLSSWLILHTVWLQDFPFNFLFSNCSTQDAGTGLIRDRRGTRGGSKWLRYSTQTQRFHQALTMSELDEEPLVPIKTLFQQVIYLTALLRLKTLDWLNRKKCLWRCHGLNWAYGNLLGILIKNVETSRYSQSPCGDLRVRLQEHSRSATYATATVTEIMCRQLSKEAF